MIAPIASIVAALTGGVTGCAAWAQDPVGNSGRREHCQFVTVAHLSSADLQSLFATRRAMWEAWFRGDTSPCAERTPYECRGAEPFVRHGNCRPTESSPYDPSESAGRLTDLQFWRNRIQVYDTVAVLQAEYSLAYDVDGNRGTMSGRATEVFLKRDGAWLRTAWHWDTED